MDERVWRVDVGRRKVQCDSVPDPWGRLGGRALIACILLDEVPPTCDPLGPKNKLIFAPGLLVGHMISSADRISVGAKSPLTGGVKESNAGGSTGLKLAHLGIKALILEGEPADDHWWTVHLSAEGGRFESAEGLVGLGVNSAAERLLKRYGKNTGISIIGPGGEMRMLASGIQNLDKDRVASRINARGGMGAIMGNKHIKAIVIDASGGEKPPLADPQLFEAAKKYYTQKLIEHPQTKTYSEFGTSAMVTMCNYLGGLPTRNFSSGSFEAAEEISGEMLRELMLNRGGKSNTTHACMAGCTIRCSNVFGDRDGEFITSPIEYETIGLMGSNLGIDNLDDIALLNREANDLGLDTIEIGAALGVAAEAGVWTFGDAARALELMADIREGTPLGRILGSGALITGRVFGVRRIPVVKGQALSAYDPRAIKGTGVTYATSPQGADHTAGLTIRAQVKHTDPEPQMEISRKMQINNAAWDTLGVCLFGSFGFSAAPGAVRDLLRGRYGWDVGEDILQELGRVTIDLEREYNRRAGFGPQDDRLPEWMTTEPLPPSGSVFDVPEDDLDRIFEW